MLTILQRMPEPLQAVLYIAAGMIIILYALGLIKTGINFLVISAGLYLIVNGLVKSGLQKRLMNKRH